jgi:amidase
MVKYISMAGKDGWNWADHILVVENTTGIDITERATIDKITKLSADGLEKLMREHELDAIVTSNSAASPVLAIGGMLGLTAPAGYGEMGVPFGLNFGGLKGYEPRLIEMAYAFEQVTKVRKVPTFLP